MVKIFPFVLFILSACSVQNMEEREAKKQWEGRCSDTASLLATTAGSPNYLACTNKMHRMRFEVQHATSGEEIGVLVVCECERKK
jgi:hypothetical protein